MNAGSYTPHAAGMFLEAITRSEMTARRARLADFRAAMADEKPFREHFMKLKAERD